MTKGFVLLGVFTVMQVIATLFFKYGSTAPQRWVPCFILANIFGASSTWILMMIYKHMPNANVANALSGGIAFMAGQVALALAFRSGLSVLQMTGIALIVSGSCLLAFRTA